VDYLLRNELNHFEGSASTRARQEARQQKLIHRLELLQARYEGNRLLYRVSPANPITTAGG
jgi:hypothetical protein